MKTTRRDFLKAGVTIAGAASGVSTASEVVFSSDASARQSSERMGEALPVPSTARKGDMLYRTLGGAGAQVSLIGLGGYHIGRLDEYDAIRLVRRRHRCWHHLHGQLLGL